ncbi:MAG TPA: zf-HC2 domain-containing protein [Vicinamibacterales bacterium]|nr:zf-HC2 domain-containing protein [Vicinamibacterales bacterium]
MSTERGHLDAETVAAWIDGGLDGPSLAAAEAHASNCERCQALLAMVVKTEPLVPGIPHLKVGGTSAWWRWWMAPIAATAAAVTLWMVVPREQIQEAQKISPPAVEAPPPEADTAKARARDEAAPPMAQATAPAGREEKFAELKRQAEKPRAAQEKLGAAAGNRVDRAASKDLQEKQDTKNNKAEERLARVEAEPARVAAAPAAQAPPPAAAPAESKTLQDAVAVTQLRKQAAPLIIVSPDPRFRWRATVDGIERSEDSGRTWFTVRLPQGEVITAGASPAPLVCWLVGRRGVVLVATDGTNFAQIPFPETVDLTAVSSSELRVATVTTADGRVLRTEDAGRNWRRQQ